MKTQIQQPQRVSSTIQNKSKTVNQASIQEILQRYKEKTIQRQDIDDEDLLQGKFENTTQLMDLDDEEEPAQMITQKVLQRDVATARTFRYQAQTLPLDGRHPSDPDTAATSETLYALTPDPHAVFRHVNAAKHFPGKNLAGAVPGGFMIGNHAEQKLIHFGGANVRNIGVDRNTCPACVNVICANAGHIEHVSEPSGTYRVTPQGMNRIGP